MNVGEPTSASESRFGVPREGFPSAPISDRDRFTNEYSNLGHFVASQTPVNPNTYSPPAAN
jgi:hypothetical protein